MSFLFLILALISSLSEATEYYVRPTEPSNASCPGQPCLTLSQYINDSEHFFKSNAVFKFLPGTHSIDHPVIIHDVQNVSLIQERSDNASALPQLISHWFPCECDTKQYEKTGCVECAAVLFQNVSCATMEGIEVSVKTPPPTGLLWNGISFISSNIISVKHVSVAESGPAGIFIVSSSNITLQYTKVLNPTRYGILLYNTNNSCIWKTLVEASTRKGIAIYNSVNSLVKSVDITSMWTNKIVDSAVELMDTLNTTLINITIRCENLSPTNAPQYDMTNYQCYRDAIIVLGANTTSMFNVSVEFATEGIWVFQSTLTTVASSHVTYTRKDGIYVVESTLTTIRCTSVAYSMGVGIRLLNTSNNTLSHLIVNKSRYGLISYIDSNLVVRNTKLLKSSNTGITLLNVENSTIVETVVKGSSANWLHMSQNRNLSIANSTQSCFYSMLQFIPRAFEEVNSSGIYIGRGRNSTILSTTVENYDRGIAVGHSEDTTVGEITVKNSRVSGIHIWHSDNILIDHTKVLNTSLQGIFIVSSVDMRVQNSRVLKSTSTGIWLENTRNSMVLDTLVESSISWAGIFIFNTVKTFIINTVISFSSNGFTARMINSCTPDHGVYVRNSSHSLIINTTVEGSLRGFSVLSSTFTTLEGVTVGQNFKGEGIAMFYSTNTAVLYATLVELDACIRFGNASNTTLKWTTMFHCNSGIWLEDAIDTTIMTISITGSSQEPGVELPSCIVLWNTYNTNIKWTNLMHCNESGIWLNNSTNTTLVDSQIIRAHVAMYLMQAAFTSITGLFLNTTDGILVEFSTNTFIENVTTVSKISGLSTVFSAETFVTNVTLSGEAPFPISIETSNNTFIETLVLIPNSVFIEIDFILSNHITLHDVDVYYSTALAGLRFLIGSATEVNLCDIFIMNGGPTHLGQGGEMDISQSTNVVISNVYFTNFNDIQCIEDVCYSQNNNVVPTNILGLPAVLFIQSSSGVIIANCSFVNNSATALKAVDSSFTFSGIVNFTSNRATRGAAIILSQRSYMTVSDNTLVIFKDNYAALTGGAIHLDGYRDQVYKSYNLTYTTNITSDGTYYKALDRKWLLNRGNYYHCFLQASISHKSLHFINNSAGQGGDVLYGGNLEMECLTQDNVCTESCLTLFKNVSDILPSNSLSNISSDPSRVCLCNTQDKPDCSIVSEDHSLYPGQTVSLSVVVVGQDFGTVQGSVFAQFADEPSNTSTHQLGTGQTIQGASQLHCNKLSYTIFSSNYGKVTLVLSTSHRGVFDHVDNEEFSQAMEQYNKPSDIIYSFTFLEKYWLHNIHYENIVLEISVTLNLTLLPCPTGFTVTNKCDCNDLLQTVSDITCNIEDLTIQHTGSVWIGPLMATDDNHTNTIEDVVVVRYCPLDYCTSKPVTVPVNFSQPDPQCNYNRSGTLCGGCQSGLSLALGSVKCLHCSNEYLALLIPFALAGVVLVFFIKLLDFTVSFGPVNGLILYANIIKANESILLPHSRSNPLTIFISWLNLDLGIETCFVDGFTAYWKTWLQFVFPVYVWVLAGCIIISARYSRRMAKLMGNNSVPVLATLFLLSYAKLLRTIITTLSYSILEYPNGQKAVWSADGNLDYLGAKHTPLFVVAVATLLFLWLPYTLLLFLGEWLHKCNLRLINRLLIRLKPFLDAHYGPLRDKHHYWFGALLLFRAAVLLMSALLPADSSSIKVFSISTSSAILLFLSVADHRVYHGTVPTLSEVCFLINLVLLTQAKLFTTVSGGTQSTASYTLVGVALVQFIGLVAFKIYNSLKTTQACVKLRQCLHRNRPNDDDDWEHYEAIVMQREDDKSIEENVQDAPECVDTMPTYGI